MASPLSHALANVMKRATVITLAMIYAAKPVTALHVIGVSLSCFGALIYQQLDQCAPSTGIASGHDASDIRASHSEELETLRDSEDDDDDESRSMETSFTPSKALRTNGVR